jgi:hypothetical protein
MTWISPERVYGDPTAPGHAVVMAVDAAANGSRKLSPDEYRRKQREAIAARRARESAAG